MRQIGFEMQVQYREPLKPLQTVSSLIVRSKTVDGSLSLGKSERDKYCFEYRVHISFDMPRIIDLQTLSNIILFKYDKPLWSWKKVINFNGAKTFFAKPNIVIRNECCLKTYW